MFFLITFKQLFFFTRKNTEILFQHLDGFELHIKTSFKSTCPLGSSNQHGHKHADREFLKLLIRDFLHEYQPDSQYLAPEYLSQSRPRFIKNVGV